jgi:hypothetical protein
VEGVHGCWATLLRYVRCLQQWPCGTVGHCCLAAMEESVGGVNGAYLGLLTCECPVCRRWPRAREVDPSDLSQSGKGFPRM